MSLPRKKEEEKHYELTTKLLMNDHYSLMENLDDRNYMQPLHGHCQNQSRKNYYHLNLYHHQHHYLIHLLMNNHHHQTNKKKYFNRLFNYRIFLTLFPCGWLLWNTFSSLRICCCWGYVIVEKDLYVCCRLLINVFVDNVEIGLLVLVLVFDRISLNKLLLLLLLFEPFKNVCCWRFKLFGWFIDGKYDKLSSFSKRFYLN